MRTLQKHQVKCPLVDEINIVP